MGTTLCYGLAPGGIKFNRLKKIKDGDDVNDTDVAMNLHTGTHIDAPKHLFDAGESIDLVELEKCIGQVLVIEIDSNVKTIDSSIIEMYDSELRQYEKILFKTANSLRSESVFGSDFVAFDPSGALRILKYNLHLIGIDYLSVQKFGKQYNEVHKVLLKNNILLLEGLELRDISPGVYDLIALPISLKNVEAAPVRAVLIES